MYFHLMHDALKCTFRFPFDTRQSSSAPAERPRRRDCLRTSSTSFLVALLRFLNRLFAQIQSIVVEKQNFNLHKANNFYFAHLLNFLFRFNWGVFARVLQCLHFLLILFVYFVCRKWIATCLVEESDRQQTTVTLEKVSFVQILIYEILKFRRICGFEILVLSFHEIQIPGNRINSS